MLTQRFPSGPKRIFVFVQIYKLVESFFIFQQCTKNGKFLVALSTTAALRGSNFSHKFCTRDRIFNHIVTLVFNITKNLWNLFCMVYGSNNLRKYCLREHNFNQT